MFASVALLAAIAGWQPPGIRPAATTLSAVLDANAAATGKPDPAFARRRERWTYANGDRRFVVDVAVRDRDVRATVHLGATDYDAGRLGGTRWRGDGNGIVHGLFGDQQGDAVDRLPQSYFSFDRADCTLAGETGGAAPRWVIADQPRGEPAVWLYVDEASGLIVREVSREGSRVSTIDFDRFTRTDGVVRPHHWRVSDGTRADDLDVTVELVEPSAVTANDVGLPARERVFAPPPNAPEVVALPARFNRGRITLEATIGGRKRLLVLDTGTASITLDPSVAGAFNPVLEHATIPAISVGPVVLGNVSVLTIPIFGGRFAGILGYDFFFGHVVHIDYVQQRVEVMSHAAAAPIFADAKTYVAAANVEHGLPLIGVRLGSISSETFAVDTGSPRLHALTAFAQRYPEEIAKRWTRTGRSYTERYLEGAVVIEPHKIASFSIGPYHFDDTPIGVEVPGALADELTSIPFDGIIGTDVLSNFDLYFDYDNGRIGFRR
ncbi:MAG TPA: hypothetical protein VGN14_07355 [Candidatus Elarobacter sp.]